LPSKPVIVAVALASIGFAALAWGQSPNDAGEEIIIEARPEQALRDFVEALTDPGRTRQLARWNGEICPAVIGIEPAQAEFMQGRIAEVATALRLRARRVGCQPTMLVLVTPDAAELAASFARQYPITLRTDGRGRLDRFVASRRPVRWLSVTDPCGPERCGLPNSRLTRATHPEFRAMLVIVDSTRIGDFSIGELSDYVSFVALGNPPLDRRAPPRSILSMFETPRPPGHRFGMTSHDATFLTGMYRSRRDASIQEQRASIAEAMKIAQ
jgi:hypothetical protein